MDSVSSTLVPSYPSISRMSSEELNRYPFEKTWVQNRKLFYYVVPPESRYSKGYKGGYSYEEELKYGRDFFKNIFSNLQREDIYLDSGAGDGEAILEYRQKFPEGAQVIGISKTQPIALEKIVGVEREDTKFFYYLADFNQLPLDSLANRVSVMTDIKGAFLYSLDPVLVIQRIGGILKEGGIVIIDYAHARIKIPKEYEDRLFLSNKGQTASGSLMHVWFRMIKGFDYIECPCDQKGEEDRKEMESKNLFFPDFYWFNEHVAILKRNRDPVEVDRLICDENAHKMYEKKEWPASWAPEYTWELSERSRNFLSQKQRIAAYL